MSLFSSLRVRLVGTIFLALTPLFVLSFFHYLPWPGFVVGFVALIVAWFAADRLVLRRIRTLYLTASRLASGDLAARTGLGREPGEFGQLARALDEAAASLAKRSQGREQNDKDLMRRSLQQTVVGALGQYAMVSTDLMALFNQAVMLVTQTLEVEFADVLELSGEDHDLLLKAGTGWRIGSVGSERFAAGPDTQVSFALALGVPVVVEDLARETRFQPSPFLSEHGVVSSILVAISGHGRSFGLLGAHSVRRRVFTEEEVHFLLSVGTLLAMAIERHRSEVELQKLAALTQQNPNPALELSNKGWITYFNDAALQLAIAVGQDHPRALLPVDIEAITSSCLATGRPRLGVETRVEGHTLSWSFHPVLASGAVHAYVQQTTASSIAAT